MNEKKLHDTIARHIARQPAQNGMKWQVVELHATPFSVWGVAVEHDCENIRGSKVAPSARIFRGKGDTEDEAAKACCDYFDKTLEISKPAHTPTYIEKFPHQSTILAL